MTLTELIELMVIMVLTKKKVFKKVVELTE